MEVSVDLVMEAIYRNDISYINYCLTKGINVNKICANGMTLIGAAAQSGNLSLLKSLFAYCEVPLVDLNFKNDNCHCLKPQCLPLGVENNRRYKNIGYFVVSRDMEENEFGDGPTPEGMEALEWDMEITESPYTLGDAGMDDDGEINMYKWYANILNRTSLMLESPERDLCRLDRHGQSILHYAVSSRNVDMVEYITKFLRTELDINQCDSCGFTSLHLASANGDVPMVRWLLSRGAHVDAIGGRNRQTALQISAGLAHIAVMRILIEAGANVNLTDTEERTALTAAVRAGTEEAVQLLLHSGARVNHEEAMGGVTSLRLAVWADNTRIACALLRAGARLVCSHRLLHTAISNNNLDLVCALVEAGSAVNIRDDHGNTPLMMACSRKNVHIVRYLLSKGADVNASSHIDGKTALHVCAQDVREAQKVCQLVELLVNHGANMNTSSYQGNVLFYAIILENRCAAVELIRHGADVNKRDDRAYVDNLSLVKRHGDLDLVKLLVMAGFRLSEMTLEPRELRTQSQDAAYDFLVYIKSNPLQLRELCRIVIRNRIGPRLLLTKIKTLPLPTLMHRYLSLNTL